MGELIQKHGREEALEFIRKGKHQAGTDGQRDTVYWKVTKKDRRKKSRKQSLGMDRSSYDDKT